MRVDPSGWLVADPGDPRVFRVETLRVTPMRGPARAVVWHWTAGYGSARTLAANAKGGAGSSFHLGIDRDGTITQLAPVTIGTLHCRGRGPFGMWNECSIGIELVNVGRVMRSGTQWLQVDNPQDPPEKHRPNHKVFVPPADVVEAHGGHWQNFDARQIRSARGVLGALRREFPRMTDADVAYGHLDLDPTRKADPGLHFMRDHLPGLVAATRPGVA